MWFMKLVYLLDTDGEYKIFMILITEFNQMRNTDVTRAPPNVVKFISTFSILKNVTL